MNENIAILTTVSNFSLYKKTSLLFPKNIPLYVIDGRNGMYGVKSILYMFKILKDKNLDWLVMADEDVIFQKPEQIFSLIDVMKKEGYTVCGVRDGGSIPHRTFNPYVINTFFSIINFKKIQQIFDKREVLKNQYMLEDEFHDDLSNLSFPYDKMSLYEPYYCFYLWLKRKGEKFLFLKAGMPFTDDKISNAVLDLEGDILLYHTWFARSYGVIEKHTIRTDKIHDAIAFRDENLQEPVVFKDITFAFKRRIQKIWKGLQMKFFKLIR